MTGTSTMSVEEAFFSYAKDKTGLSPKILADCLQKAAHYCHLKQSLLGVTDAEVVHTAQQKVAEGKLLRFRFGKDAQAIRNITQLYYSFIKSYHEPKEDITIQPTNLVKDAVAEQVASNAAEQVKWESMPIISMEKISVPDENVETAENADIQVETISVPTDGEISEEAPNGEWILVQLKARGLTYQDKRNWGGCLWIVGDHGLDVFVQACKVKGYTLSYKADGCKTYPNCPVWWTKDRVEEENDTSIFRSRLDKSFKLFLLSVKKLTKSTATQYSQSIEAVERFLLERRLNLTLDTDDADEVQKIYDALMGRRDFADWNSQRHHQYSAALAQYVCYLRQDKTDTKDTDTLNAITIKDVVIKVLHDAGKPLTISEIMQRVETEQLYRFNSSNPTMIVYHGIRRYCKGMKAQNHAPVDIFDRFTDEAGQIRYMLIDEVQKETGNIETWKTSSADDRWLPILQDSFPNGYILNDFLGQFQAAAFWQERYGEECPIQGAAIDAAMKAIGVVRDGRVLAENGKDKQLISAICAEINDILSRYTTIYPSCIYDRYQEQLAACSIYTEQVMAQQLLSKAKATLCSVNHAFAKRGQYASVTQDTRKVLRDHGGPMTVGDIAEVLWFIPYDVIYHCLSVDAESLNIGSSTWMLAEHFPLTREDAGKIGDVLDEYFLTSDYVRALDLMPLLKDRLPSIADDLNGMNYIAVFNIAAYYLRNRFSFTKAIITPKGSNIDITDLFKSFAAEHDTFTLADLEMLASELKLPIYWESTYAGGAVRVSKTDFVNKRLINFDVEAIDEVLQNFCPGDYLPLMSVSSAMLMHLPSCGYRWNGYLLQSYVFGFSEVFRLSYASLGKTGYYGAMVRRSCEAIDNYGSLVERVLTDDDTWETTADALDVLVKHGYQVLRRYKDIDTAVAKAKQNKLLSDG